MLPPPLPPKKTPSNTCPTCGKNVDPKWEHCGYCGGELSRKEVVSTNIGIPTRGAAQRPPSINGPIRRTASKKSPLVWITIASGLIAIASLTILVVMLLNKDRTIAAAPPSESQEAEPITEVTHTSTSTITVTSTLPPTQTNTPTPTHTPQPTATTAPIGVSAIVPEPSEWKCQGGPSSTVYTYDGMLDSENVIIVAMNRYQTWFNTISQPSGQTCWVEMSGLDLGSFDKTDIPIVDDPPPPSTIYYGYKFAECPTGWTIFSTSYVQCRKRPACYLRYPQQGTAYDSPAEALLGCQNSGGNNIYCVTTVPYTFDVISPNTTSYKCNIPRVDHSDTDINYELFWLKVP